MSDTIKVLIVLELIPEGTKCGVFDLKWEEYLYLRQADDYIVNIDDPEGEEEEAALKIMDMFDEGYEKEAQENITNCIRLIRTGMAL